MVGLDEKWGLPRWLKALGAAVCIGVGGGWGGRLALSAEFAAVESRWQAKLDQQQRVWEAVVAAERATSAATYATREQLTETKLANERFYNKILREMRR